MNDLPWKVSMTLSGQFSTSQRSLFVKHGESADFSASFARSFLKTDFEACGFLPRFEVVGKDVINE